jgi:hypothetical protein
MTTRQDICAVSRAAKAAPAASLVLGTLLLLTRP